MHISGYNSSLQLEPEEIGILYYLSCLRICQSVVSSAFEQTRDPENKYILVSAKPGWACLEKLYTTKCEDQPTERLFAALKVRDVQQCSRACKQCAVC